MTRRIVWVRDRTCGVRVLISLRIGISRIGQIFIHIANDARVASGIIKKNLVFVIEFRLEIGLGNLCFGGNKNLSNLNVDDRWVIGCDYKL